MRGLLFRTAVLGSLLKGPARWLEGFAAGPWGAAWLFVFSFAESSFFPVPPDVLLIALCLTETALESRWLMLLFAGVCTAGSVLGGLFGYFIGRKAGRPILLKLASEERVKAAEDLLARYDVWAVGAAGFTPIPYKVFTIASGLLRIKIGRFAAISAASRGARFFIEAAFFYFFGSEAKSFIESYFEWLAIGLLVVGVGGFLALKLLGKVTAGRARRFEGEGGGADGD